MQSSQVLAQMGIKSDGQPPGPPGVEPRNVVTTATDQGPTLRKSITRENRITGKTISYDQIVDELLLSPPGETQGMLARRLGYSQAWISRLIASDAFQTRLAQRLEQDIEPERREIFRLRFATIEEEARGILLASLTKLADRLQDPAGVPDELLIKSTSVTSKLLGYGARQEPQAPKVEMHLHLEQLASNLRRLNGAPVASEGVTIDQPPGPPGVR